MEIDRNKMYINKTKTYLLPVLLEYGDVFVNHFKQVFKLGYGINDEILPDNLKFDNHIFILFNAYKNSNNGSESSTFTNFLSWIRNQPYFEFDYPFDDIRDGDQHMIVLKVPENLSEAHTSFLNGRYSKMYSANNLNKLFGKDDPRYQIFTRKPEAKKLFINKINKEFDVTFTDVDFEDDLMEVEHQMIEKEEIFNFNKNKKSNGTKIKQDESLKT